MFRNTPPVITRYSSAFKRHIVSEIESGILSIELARKKYSIRGGETVQKWIRKFGKDHLLAKVVRVETADERNRIRELEKQKRQLESALAQSQVKILALESLVEAAEEHYKADLKKNFGGMRSNGQRNTSTSQQRE